MLLDQRSTPSMMLPVGSPEDAAPLPYGRVWGGWRGGARAAWCCCLELQQSERPEKAVRAPWLASLTLGPCQKLNALLRLFAKLLVLVVLGELSQVPTAELAEDRRSRDHSP